MTDDLCGWPFLKKRMQDEQTLEGMIDSMGLKAILMLLQDICDAKAQHIEENWQDHRLAKEWTTAGNKLGQWAAELSDEDR